MAHSNLPKRLGFWGILIALIFSLSLPALAFFSPEAERDPEAPLAENLTLQTYRDVAVCGTFSGRDPQGDPLTFRITKTPARGAVTLAEDDPSRFTYTPYERKTGKDTFTYVAIDPAGHSSPPAKVSLHIAKPRTKVTYADMQGDPAHKAAIALAEEKIFVGETMGDTWFFHPQTPVTREAFLTMAMDTVGLDAAAAGQVTGFADDDHISVWAKPYVSAAQEAGMIQGSGDSRAVFAPSRTITQSEAAVLLDRLLHLADVADQGTLPQDAAPAWAHQAVVNLSAVGILEDRTAQKETLSAPLTRAQAAEMLQSAMEVLDFRKKIW